MTINTVNLNEFVKSALAEVLLMFNIENEFLEEKEEDKLELKHELNVILGVTGSVKGNLTVSLSRPAALRIASKMMGGMEVLALDEMSTSAVCEFANMLGGTTISKIQSQGLIDMSPPTLIMSKGEVTVISKTKAHSMKFSVAGEGVVVSYAVQS